MIQLIHSRICMLFLVLLTCLPGLPAAQGFTITGTVPQGVTGIAQLTLYIAGTRPQATRQRIRKGSFIFTGDVKQPTVASLSIGDKAPLYLWVENAEIAIAYNPAQPSSSRITGSRSNSEYRYALEICSQDAVALGGNGLNGVALLQYVSEHLASRYSPFLLWLYYNDDCDALDSLCCRMTGEATEAYHFPLLKRKAAAMRSSAEGCKVPDVTIPFGQWDIPAGSNAASLASTKIKRLTKSSNMVPLDSLLSSTTTFLLVSPSWLENEKHQLDSLCAAIRRSKAVAQAVWAMSDKAPQGWDELYMQQLNIERLPYIILLDRQGKIVARDVRVWEAERLLNVIDNNR